MIAEPVIAHRGCALLRPENSLAAMRHTRELGVGWVEIDANLLGDGTAVMFHDDELDRLTPGTGNLSAHTWASVRDLDVGSHFSPDYSDERIPALTDAIVAIRDLGLSLNLEIKVYPHFTAEQIVSAVILILDEHWIDFSQLIISSFDTQALRLLSARRPEWQLGHLCEMLPDGWEAIADELGVVSIHCDHRPLTAAQAQAIKARNLDLYCYTVNDLPAAQALWAMGVDGIITDNPLLMK